MITRKKTTSGFTLVEFLLYFGLVSILFVVMTELFLSLLDLKMKSQAISGMSIDAQYLPIRLQHDIEKASSVVTPATLGAVSSSLQLMINGETVTYSVQNEELVRTSPAGTMRVLGDTRLSQLQFQRLGKVNGKHALKISYRLRSKVTFKAGPDFVDYQTTLGLR